ncbi:MAG: polysaccharide pyruvyl transferase family protein [Actinomycetia bacterium]|nr:polysaccharide pyruvyl transferase family protein [Actinomycetes bacterium]
MTATGSGAPEIAGFPVTTSDSTPQERRRVLFLGTHGQANVGDELLLDTFLTELGPGNTYAVNSYEPAATTTQLADRFDVTVFDTGSDHLGLLRNLLRCNVVVFGGGNILKELYRSVGRWKYSTLTMVLAVVLLARLTGKPVLMANVGIGPVESAPGRLLVRVILRLVWLISVRDEGSYRLAVSVGGAGHKLLLVPDAVWVRDPDSLRGAPDREQRGDDGTLRIALNLNKDVDVADEWERFLDRLVAALGEVADARPVEFHALPMQCGFKSGTDLEILEEVLGRLDAPVCIHAPADHHEVASIIAGCDLVVSERLHAIILSVVIGCPVVALPYDVKVRELASQLGIEERSFDVSADLDPGALAAAILRAVDDSGAERDRMAALAAAKRHDAASGFAALRSWVAAPRRTWELSSA